MQTSKWEAGWLAFDLNILQRIDFKSVALPFSGDARLGARLKCRGVKVLANDLLQSNWTRAVALIQNNGERLTDDDVNLILEDVYVPRHKLANPGLRNWFSETDAWWFDNARQNVDRMPSPIASALAATLIMDVGDYVHSFSTETAELRRPLSTVFRRLWTVMPEPVNNGRNNTCSNRSTDEFIAEGHAELMFLRLPAAGVRASGENGLWREEWLRGGVDFWGDFSAARSGTLGMPVETKSQYLSLLEVTLGRASNIPRWAIAHVDSGFISTSDVVNVVGKIRDVDAIYTKDFSELTGCKAVIVTA